jgi:hypothetical protein
MPSPAWLRWLAPAIPVAAAFALALTRIEDPDAFTHLALGRDLLEHRGWPTHEPFSFPSLDRPYYNSEWLFDVVLFLAYLAGGTAGVVVLKASIIALTVAILWLDSRTWSDTTALRPAGLLIRSAVLTAVVLAIRHRFVERPDIALMVFLAFTIYALDAYLDAGRRWIFLLPIVQIVWANTHPSIIVGLVPFVAVLGGGTALRVGVRLIQRWWRPLTIIPSWRKLGTVAAVLGGVLVASVLNPHRFDALVLPFTLADQPWFRQEIMELQPPQPASWPAPFVMTALLFVSFLGTVGRLPLIPALLALPFVRLGLSAVRFVFLLELVAAPILARNLIVLSGFARRPVVQRLVLGAAAAAVGVVVIVAVVTGAGGGPFADVRKVPGRARHPGPPVQRLPLRRLHHVARFPPPGADPRRPWPRHREPAGGDPFRARPSRAPRAAASAVRPGRRGDGLPDLLGRRVRGRPRPRHRPRPDVTGLGAGVLGRRRARLPSTRRTPCGHHRA